MNTTKPPQHTRGGSPIPTPMTKRLHTRKANTLYTTFKHHCQQTNAHCWLCGQPIDYTKPPTHPNGFQIDHMYPISTHPQHQLDPANLKPSHAQCNQQRSNKPPNPPISTPSKQW